MGVFGIPLIYFVVYSFAAVFYVWYRYLLAFITGTKTYKKTILSKHKITVVVPVYNEQPELFERCIKSIVEQDIRLELIVVNDGSNNKTSEAIGELKKRYAFKYVKFPKNQGKRVAMALGVKEAKGDLVVFVDSDTILEPNSISELIKPFGEAIVGCTTGNVEVLNTEKFLGKMIASRYWYAFNIERKGMNYSGVVPVASGVLSAFRKDIILPKMGAFLNQKFLGKPQQYGDDRHLTNLVLEQGYKVYYVDSAMAYTYVPESLKTLFMQQMRWRKSYIRETLYAAKFMLRVSKLLTFDTLYTAFMTYNSIIMRAVAWPLIFLYPLLIIPYFVLVTIMAFVHNIALFVNRGIKFGLYSILYAYLYEFLIFWSLPAAILTLSNNEWGTR